MNFLKAKNIIAAAALTLTISSCSENIEISEQKVGPFLTVCAESYQPYSQTNNIIDSLKTKLNEIDVPTEKSLGIFYEKYNGDKKHSIVGVIVGEVTDSVLIRKLERQDFMVRTIGETNCMTATTNYDGFDSDLREKVQTKFSEYASQNNYLEIPNGETGITEIYSNGKIQFAAEIKPKN